MKLASDEFVDPEQKYLLKFVAPYERQGRTDSTTPGSEKPKVKVRAFFRKKISLKDHHELHGVNERLKSTEHNVHFEESAWHKEWQERVKDFCEIERRFYPGGIPTKEGYKIADAYYPETNTAIEFQKSFDDSALDKSEFYTAENIRLVWLFYLPTLSVFEADGRYKIGEDNFYHFFRIDDVKPGFYKNNVIFIQDKNNQIYFVDKLERVETGEELEGTVRFFQKGLKFASPDEFAHWLRFEWPKSSLYKKSNVNDEARSITEILSDFEDKPDKMFYLQNCIKKDKHGNNMIYAFVKDAGKIRGDSQCYYSYRCFDKVGVYYRVNSNWEMTIQSKTKKKWILLATNLKKYHDEVEVGTEGAQ